MANPYIDPAAGYGAYTAGFQSLPTAPLVAQKDPGASNPYLAQTADAMRAMSNQNLAQSILPGVNAGAIGAGGYGGSRMAIARGVAAGNAETGLNQSISNMYLQDYQQRQQLASQQAMAEAQMAAQRDIANQQNALAYTLGIGNLGLGYLNASNNYNLGLGNLGIGMQNANTNAAGVGANLFNTGTQGQINAGQGLFNSGVNQMNAGYTPYANYGNTLSQFSGLGGGQQTNQNVASNPFANFLGGLLGGSQVSNLLFNGG